MQEIDVTFDFRSDTPPGKDPDSFSPTLRKYHKLLWSKPLPSGDFFGLDDATPKAYLHHRSKVGEFFPSSDSVIHTFSTARRVAHIISQIEAEEVAAFDRLSYTIAGMMIFPGNRINNKMTINSARGLQPKIIDRFDLTLECIRRHYLGEASPLSDVLARYADFFQLFGGFRGYIEFFLLQDIVTADHDTVKFFMAFDDFKTSPLPDSVDIYLAYKKAAIEFLNARNRRILEYFRSSVPQ